MTKTIGQMQTDAVLLSALINGAEVLADTATSADERCQYAKMASNSLPAIFEDMRRRADALADELELLERQTDNRGAA